MGRHGDRPSLTGNADWRHAISAASEPARRAGSARPSFSAPGQQFAFQVLSGVNPASRSGKGQSGGLGPSGAVFCKMRATMNEFFVKFCERWSRTAHGKINCPLLNRNTVRVFVCVIVYRSEIDNPIIFSSNRNPKRSSQRRINRKLSDKKDRFL